MENTLIIASAYSGHILEITPLIRVAAHAGPVSVVIHPRQHLYFQHNRQIARIYDQNDDNTESLATFLYTQPFTRIINLQDDRFSREVLAGFPKLKRSAGLIGQLLKQFLPQPLGNALLKKRWKEFKLTDDGLGLDYKIGETEMIKADDLPASHQAGFYTIVVDRSVIEKVDLAEVIRDIDHPVVLISNADAIPLATKLDDGDPRIYNAAGKFSLNEMADIIRQSKLVVTGYNDFLYFAIANNRKVVFLPTGTGIKVDYEKLYAASFSAAKNGRFFKALAKSAGNKLTADLRQSIREML